MVAPTQWNPVHYKELRGSRRALLATGKYSEELMTNQELAQTLDRLHEQLSQSPQLDEATVQSLRALLDEIEAATVRTEEAATGQDAGTPEHEAAATSAQELSLSGKLRKTVEDFEFRHPQLTVTLSQIADSLAEMGI